ncbi:MAG: YkgJ family cysteine cluster protein [Methanomassiliicoccales archaeon]|jgi:Fe-S-cluster containining protein
MSDEWYDKATEVCQQCGGRCCMNAHPPLTDERIRILTDNDVSCDNIEFAGYKRLKVKDDNMCVMFKDNGLCAIHGFKPETCVAGPFTFDVKEGVIEIYMKKESICPLVAVLKQDCKAYDEQYKMAVEKIIRVVAFLPEEELWTVCRIEEPDTEKVEDLIIG